MQRKRLLAYLNASLLGILVSLFGYILFWPVDVLTDWTLKLPAKSFVAGQEVTIDSRYNKVTAVSGESHRYIECNDKSGIKVRYPLNEAIADRKPGQGRGTGVQVTLPTTIPDLPTTCRISISIEYRINLLKTHTEYNETNDFELLPESAAKTGTDKTVVSVVTSSSTPDRQETSQAQPTSSSPEPASQPEQQPQTVTPAPQQAEQQPSLVERLLNLIGI